MHQALFSVRSNLQQSAAADPMTESPLWLETNRCSSPHLPQESGPHTSPARKENLEDTAGRANRFSCRKPVSPLTKRGDLRLGEDHRLLPQDMPPRNRTHTRQGPVFRGGLETRLNGATDDLRSVGRGLGINQLNLICPYTETRPDSDEGAQVAMRMSGYGTCLLRMSP